MANKKDTVATDAPATPTQPSNVRAYFTQEIHEQMAGMTVKEMENVMKEMMGTRQWIALLKYTNMRTPLLDATLRSANPSTDPHKISWAQGAMAGLCDIEGYVIDLNATPQRSEPVTPEPGQEPEVKTEGIIVG